MAASAGGKVKLGLAAALNGFSREELGFDPMMVPAWLQTSIESDPLRSQAHTGVVVVELGTLIDGVSDMGFRNMLTSAKRDYGVRLPQNEVFHALTEAQGGSEPARAPAPVQAPPPQVQPAAAPVMFAAAPPAPPQPVSSALFAPASPPPAPAQPVERPPQAPIAFSPFPMAPSESRMMFEAKQPQAAEAEYSAPPPAPGVPASGSVMEGMAGLFAAKVPEVQSEVRPTTMNLQPKPGVFSAFSGSSPAPASVPQFQPQPASQAFDPFAPPAQGSASTGDSGFSSAQLLGQSPAVPASRPLIDPFAAAKPVAEPAPAPLIPENPAPTAFFAAPRPDPSLAATVPIAPPKSVLFPPAPEVQRPSTPEPAIAKPATLPEMTSPFSAPAPVAANAAPQVPSGHGKHSFLGLSPTNADSDQLLLRALLGTDEKLDANRVVRLLATQPGLCACVCLHDSSVLSHAKADVPDAASFQQQAAEIARQVRGLAPLIGIADAETFTLNAGTRLITFCYPGDIILGVLHENEPTTGLRDKITLVARELVRMLD